MPFPSPWARCFWGHRAVQAPLLPAALPVPSCFFPFLFSEQDFYAQSNRETITFATSLPFCGSAGLGERCERVAPGGHLPSVVEKSPKAALRAHLGLSLLFSSLGWVVAA